MDDDPAVRWDRRFAEQPWPAEPDGGLVERVAPLAPGRALDLGCGPGRNAIWLARQGWAVTGVDLSPVGLAQAAARSAQGGARLDLVEADLLGYVPEPGGFDLVVVANLHFPPGEREPFFARAVAALAPGGHLYVAGRHRDSPDRAGDGAEERRYSEELLANLLAPLAVEVRLEHRPTGAGGPERQKVVAWATDPRAAGTPGRGRAGSGAGA